MPSHVWLLVGVTLFSVLPASAAEPASPGLHPVEVRNPPLLGKVDSGLRDASGAAIGIECDTCHGAQDGALASGAPHDSDFHGEVALEHGSLSCASCHDPIDRTRLRLADGERLPFRDVLQLCGQCHGPKLRAFEHGAHGGGRGYWDRTRGPWVRNNCVACHDAHEPSYPLVSPAPPPNDRFVPAAPHGAGPRYTPAGAQADPAKEAPEHE